MKFSNVSVLAGVLVIDVACGNANQINAHSLQTANKSGNYIKQRLPVKQK